MVNEVINGKEQEPPDREISLLRHIYRFSPTIRAINTCRFTRGSTSAWAGFVSIHDFNCILLVEARSNELGDYRGFPDAILIAGDNVLINRVTGVQGLFNVIGFHLGSSP
jgi:hypothetical protein